MSVRVVTLTDGRNSGRAISPKRKIHATNENFGLTNLGEQTTYTIKMLIADWGLGTLTDIEIFSFSFLIFKHYKIFYQHVLINEYPCVV